jgi:hypothetical protein
VGWVRAVEDATATFAGAYVRKTSVRVRPKTI